MQTQSLRGAILQRDFRFRGSLGPESFDLVPFTTHMAGLHAALREYHCRIDELLAHGAPVAARMTFSGLHLGLFFDEPATGRQITWSGAAFLTTAMGRITCLWVLGHVDAVKRQLGLVEMPSPLV